MTLRFVGSSLALLLVASSCTTPPGSPGDAGCIPQNPNDDANCGACGAVCPAGQACAASACHPTQCAARACTGDQVCVNEVCTDKTCVGVSCESGKVCVAGNCVGDPCLGVNCTAPTACVGGRCIDIACMGVACSGGAVCLGGQCLTCCLSSPCAPGTSVDVCGALKQLGAGCADAGECASAVCSGGMCCDRSCTGACEACSVAAGAAMNGFCSYLDSSHVCRAAVGSCDVPEVCTGVASACPANVVADAGTSCGATVETDAGTCTFSTTCTNSGSRTASVVTSSCDPSGQCQQSPGTRNVACVRDTTGTVCGATVTDAGVCSYFSCAAIGSRTQTVTSYTCDGLEMCSPSVSEGTVDAGCTRDPTGLTCGATTVDAGTCSFATVCDTTGSRNETTTTYQCSAASACVAMPSSSTMTCSQTPDVQVCGARLVMLSTQAKVETGAGIVIAGFVVSGPGVKQVLIRALGLTASDAGVLLADPKLDLYSASTLIASNDNWKSTQQAQIAATGLAPLNDTEAAVLLTVDAGSYTAQLSGVAGGQGIGAVQVYDLQLGGPIHLVNISTRAQVNTGTEVMIGGLTIGGSLPRKILFRVLGPSLTGLGVPGALSDPMMVIRDNGDGGTLGTSNDWQTEGQVAAITDAGLAPTDSHESALILTLNPGSYSAVVSGVGGATGIALFEAYEE